jgi:hypothetical protein
MKALLRRRSVLLCHSLCHNPTIPVRVRLSRSVPLGARGRAGHTRQTRMNTALVYHSVSCAIVCIYSVLGNGMEEVVGSIPTRSTNFKATYFQ